MVMLIRHSKTKPKTKRILLLTNRVRFSDSLLVVPFFVGSTGEDSSAIFEPAGTGLFLPYKHYPVEWKTGEKLDSLTSITVPSIFSAAQRLWRPMTTLGKLAIQGIRSYGADQPEVIEFQQPLTIILGKNGCGKTTIIEALKYITTGTLPPLGDKGKSFVHDPKMAGKAIVKAQIKLGFRTAAGMHYVAIRSFQCTQKKKTMEFKAVESVLSTKNELNEKVSVSQRCADMEKQVPGIMGVSKAVLENVIFCHQEDSNWPLSDSKTLKLKFDEIFEASRYTKALDTIRKLKGEQQKKIRQMEASLGVLEVNLKNAKKYRDELEITKAKILDKSNAIKEIDRKLEGEQAELENEIDRKLEGEQAELEKYRARDQATKQLRQRCRDMDYQKRHMMDEISQATTALDTEFEEEDEELDTYWKKMQQDLPAKEGKVRELEKTVQKKEIHYHELVEECQQAVHALGAAEAQSAEYKEEKNHLNTFLRRLADDYKIMSVMSGLEPPEAAAACIDPLRRECESRKNKYKELQSSGRQMEANFNQAIAAIEKKEIALKERIQQKKREYSSTREAHKQKREQKQQLEQQLGANQDIQAQISVAKEKLEEFDRKDKTGRMNAEIAEVQGKVHAETARITVLQTERDKLSSQRDMG
eukprot:g8829.t1